MGSNRHQVGGTGVVILAASFMAGMVVAIAVSLDPSSWAITEPFFGLPDEMAAAPRDTDSAHTVSSPSQAPEEYGPGVPEHLQSDVAVATIVDTLEAPDDRLAALPEPSDLVPPTVELPVDNRSTVSAPPEQVVASAPRSAPALLRAPPQLVPLTPQFAARPVPRRDAVSPPPLVSVGGQRDRVDEPVREAVVTDAPDLQSLPATPLPGANWSDPDGVNWVDANEPKTQSPNVQSASNGGAQRQATGGRMIDRLTDRFTESRSQVPAQQRLPVLLGDRLRSRLRGESGSADDDGAAADADPGSEARASDGWPTPTQLLETLENLAGTSGSEARGRIAQWANETLDVIRGTLATDGPADPRAAEPLVVLSERVNAGMAVADEGASPMVASQTRRAALAVARRVAVWRAAAAWCRDAGAGSRLLAEDASLLLACLERYESSASAADAATVRMALAAIAKSPSPTAEALARAVSDYYHAANVRIAVHREFVSRMLPESTVTTNAVNDFVLGRPVKGRSTVEQSLAVRFVPHATEIRMELVVNGEVASRTVTASGPVSIHSRGQATFTVAKPITLTASGLAFGNARGTASSNARLASIETKFDNVPVMGELVRTIAKNQHDGAKQEANREVSSKVVGRACRQVDQEAEPKFAEMAEKIREKVWQPLVTLGLEPTPVALETTEDVASMRLRLAAANQLSAHTPRPRAPSEALVSFQVHETVANNAVGQFGFAGKRLDLPELSRLVCERLGIDPEVPDDLPEDVVITFAREEPLRLECRDGLVHVRVALEAFECGRRTWYDVIAKVAYRPIAKGSQVTLEREGPVQISGPGHQGRMEIGLRTIFGKIFAQSRPIPLVPEKVTKNPALADLVAVQALATDGWLAIALAEPQTTMTSKPAKTSPTAKQPPASDRRFFRR
jgi:hypothetical protein